MFKFKKTYLFIVAVLICGVGVLSVFVFGNISEVKAQETPSIKIISPNGGEKLEIGKNYDITWEATGVEKVDIYLIDGESMPKACVCAFSMPCVCDNWKQIASGIPASFGKHSFSFLEIDFDDYSGIAGDNYKIAIIETSGPYKFNWTEDSSDNYFSIDFSDKVKIQVRDVKRVVDIKQMQVALELDYNDNNKYFINKSGIPTTLTSIGKIMKLAPEARMPNDGICTVANNSYLYVSTNEAGTVLCKTDKCENYMLQFCIGSTAGTLSAGLHCATNSGISNTACPAPFVQPSNSNISPAISGVSGPITLKTNETGTWTIKANDPGNGQLTYSVIWGDEAMFIGDTQLTPKTFVQITTFTHSYNKAGNYTPTFTITNNQGFSAKTSVSVKVGDISDEEPRDARRLSDIKQIQTALELYYNEVSSYPEKIESGQSLKTVDNNIIFMKVIPVNPTPGGTPYKYTRLDKNDYVLEFSLEVGLEIGFEYFKAGTYIASPKGINKNEKICPIFYEPVCGINGKMYKNKCIAEEAGTMIDNSQQCMQQGCAGNGEYTGGIVMDLKSFEIRDYKKCCRGLIPYSDMNDGIRGVCQDSNITAINANANRLHNNQFETILSELKQLRDKIKEQATELKYLRNLTAGVKELTQSAKDAINNFITYGVDSNTQKLGAGERAAVINSYKFAFDKLPETEAELTDVIKIANGRFPGITNDKAEKRAKDQFVKIYKRIPDLNDNKDNAAIKVMAYGLRQKAENRNLNSEKTGIKTFKSIYNYTPKTTEDWNAMQAITYSGSAREKDSDNDLLSDKMELQYGTNP
ncbi:MAG: hypothetical protein Q7T79_03435, partial [bacterium]|nr:hypothetical protein [bacterium]